MYLWNNANINEFFLAFTLKFYAFFYYTIMQIKVHNHYFSNLLLPLNFSNRKSNVVKVAEAAIPVC